ncbi:hypothetical protein CCACVL1_07818 [Corchorus capsularis]|uniref:Uncharacterized protein n=1 Tax=Corchorus capsularis TaxID=210143 RepID=A0A1R3J3P6_COCAP|nr:hypothetical protein CCACVL1_07818 [Corchorus capsularis]
MAFSANICTDLAILVIRKDR